MAELLRIEVYATTRQEEAVVSVRVDGKQVAQIAHTSDTPAAAITAALATAIALIAKEEVRHGR